MTLQDVTRELDLARRELRLAIVPRVHGRDELLARHAFVREEPVHRREKLDRPTSAAGARRNDRATRQARRRPAMFETIVTALENAVGDLSFRGGFTGIHFATGS